MRTCAQLYGGEQVDAGARRALRRSPGGYDDISIEAGVLTSSARVSLQGEHVREGILVPSYLSGASASTRAIKSASSPKSA